MVTPNTVRMKVQCLGTQDFGVSERVDLMAVYSPDPQSENRRFWKATPSAHFTLYIDNPDARGVFLPGVEYHVDFSVAGLTGA